MEKLKIKMKTVKIFLLLLIALTLVFCKNRPQENLETKTIAELVKLGCEDKDEQVYSKICSLLNDSLTQDACRRSWYTGAIIIDLDEETIDWEFIYEGTHIPEVADRLIYHIDIKDGNIYVDDRIMPLDSLAIYAEQYIFEPEEEVQQITNISVQVEDFGNIVTSRVVALINLNYADTDEISTESWSAFFNSLRSMIALFDKKRDEAALEKWGKPYNSLSFEDKKKIISFLSYRITVGFNNLW